MSALPDLEDLAVEFCNELDQLDAAVVLVLDDYHQISASAVGEFLNQIVKRPPRKLHLVIVTRRDPPLDLQILRASGLLTETRMQQLAFTAAETRDFLHDIFGDAVSEHALQRLHRRTEGWPAALRLAVLAAPAHGATDSFADNLPDNKHAVSDYLMQEVLAKRTPAVRNWLFHTAFLDRFCARLCEAVLPDDRRESIDLSGDDFMSRIHESGLFGIALDDRQEWYRYHHLFQTMLRDRAVSVLGEDEIRDIRIRASKWFEDNGYLEDAISQLLQG